MKEGKRTAARRRTLAAAKLGHLAAPVLKALFFHSLGQKATFRK
jgi:hypothetical protein